MNLDLCFVLGFYFYTFIYKKTYFTYEFCVEITINRYFDLLPNESMNTNNGLFDDLKPFYLY